MSHSSVDSSALRSTPKAAQRHDWVRPAIWLVGGAIVFAVPYLMSDSTRIVGAFVATAIFAVMCYGPDLLLAYLGEVSLGHTLFWALGAYVTGYCAVNLGWGGWACAGASVMCSLAVALFLGAAMLRTQAFVFALVTFASAIVAMEIVSNWDLVGGSDGIVGLPPLTLWTPLGTYQAQGDLQIWPVAFLLLALTLFLVSRFRVSRLGIAALLVQMNPALATSMGHDARRIRLAVFALSSPITALAGWLYAYQRSYVGPDLFQTYFLILMLIAIIFVGGRALLGPLIGIALLQAQQGFVPLDGDESKILLGGVLAVVLVTCPDGLGAALSTGLRRLGRRSAQAAADHPPSQGSTTPVK